MNSATKQLRNLLSERRRLVRRDAQEIARLLAMLIDDIDAAWPDLHCAPEIGSGHEAATRDHLGDVRAAALELNHAVARLITHS
jgi:hypothetical protein